MQTISLTALARASGPSTAGEHQAQRRDGLCRTRAHTASESGHADRLAMGDTGSNPVLKAGSGREQAVPR